MNITHWDNPVLNAMFSRGYMVVGNNVYIFDCEKTREAFIKMELTRDTNGKIPWFKSYVQSIAFINRLM